MFNKLISKEFRPSSEPFKRISNKVNPIFKGFARGTLQNKRHKPHYTVTHSVFIKPYTNFTSVKLALIQNSITLKSQYKKPHKLARLFGLYPYTFSTGGVNWTKLVFSWQNVYFLLTNLFYYNTNLLVFGTSLFRREANSLNWGLNRNINLCWRYVIPNIAVNSNTISDSNNEAFAMIKTEGINVGIVVDTATQVNSLYYLQRYHIYSVGLVATTDTGHRVNFPIITGTPNFFNQLFFFRFILHTKQHIARNAFESNYNLWSYSKNHIINSLSS